MVGLGSLVFYSISRRELPRLLRAVSTIFAGFYGSLARVMLKAVIDFVKHLDCSSSAKPSDECAFHDFRFYVVTLALISQFAAQLYWINWALGRFESTLKTCKKYYLHPKTHAFGALKSNFRVVCLVFFCVIVFFEVRAFQRYVVCLVWTMSY